jgi:autotransporter-associated beta strand protein
MRGKERLNRRRTIWSLRACAVAVAALQAPAAAATQNWAPTAAGPFAYNTSANWNGGAGPVPASGDTANMQLDLTANQAVTVSPAVSINQLNIGDAAQSGGVFQNQAFTGSTITFTTPVINGFGVINSQGGNNAISNNVATSGINGTRLMVNVNSGTLTLGGDAVAMTVNGPGTLIFSGSKTTGGTTINSGATVRAANANAFAPNGGIGGAGTVNFNGFDQNVGSVSGTLAIQMGAGTMTTRGGQFQGTISGTGGVTLNGSGAGSQLALFNPNSFSGPVTIDNGTVRPLSNAVLGDGSATNMVIFGTSNAGALWMSEPGTHITRSAVLNGRGDISGIDDTTWSGNISGPGGLSVSTTGSLYLTGANTYAGDTIIDIQGSYFGPGVVAAAGALGAPTAGLVLKRDGALGNLPSAAFTTSRSFSCVNGGFSGGLRGANGSFTFEGAGNNSFSGSLWMRSGTLNFNRTGGVTTDVAPGAMIVLDGSSLQLGGTADALSDGVHHVAVRLSNGPPGALTVNQGTKNIGVVDGAGTVAVNSGATLIVHAFRGFNGTVAVNGTGTAELRHNGYPDGTSKLQGITIDPAARFDIQNNGLVWDYTGATVKPLVRQYLINGRGGTGMPTWTSPGGITSSAAAAAGYPHLEAVGYLDNADVAGGPYAAFRGLTGLDATAIFVARTIPGDSNLDFIVNSPDLSIVGANYLQANVGDWYKGDFNYDGLVNDLDAQILGSGWDPGTTPPTNPELASQYGQTFANAFYDGLAHPVPEPSGVVMVGTAAGLLAVRRRHGQREK